MEKIPESEIFATAEWPLAVSIASHGILLQWLDRSNRDRVRFCFRKTDEVLEIAAKFWNGSLMVNALAFHNSSKLLKARLKNESE